MKGPVIAVPRTPREGGFTLIEVLIAVVIFAVGVLGLVGVQTATTRVSSDARFRSEAAALADELLARMQSASRATVATDYATGGALFNDWLNNRVRATGVGLPSANATVAFGAVNADPNSVRIVITWTPPRETIRDTSGVATAISLTRQHVTVSALYD